MIHRRAVAHVDELQVRLLGRPADGERALVARVAAGGGWEDCHPEYVAPIVLCGRQIGRAQPDCEYALGTARRGLHDLIPEVVGALDHGHAPGVLDTVAERLRAWHGLGHCDRKVLHVVAARVRVDAVVVGELEDKVVVLVAEADHRLGPRAAVWPVARRLAARLKLLMPQHAEAEHELVEAQRVLERADLCHPVERAHVARELRRDADVIHHCRRNRHGLASAQLPASPNCERE